ncbi:quercetin 2,3-dioxygenase [Klenkia terrae]|uniref:Quercetin 2,3-dioxygenase n=2 Tax=root TaxID=1 RepID=A0ABU8E493_9ACTN|nr:quercetin 2,3-dioxygenase [Klenkia terrae]SSC21951.1 Cupin domain protein [Klenkia terrae]
MSFEYLIDPANGPQWQGQLPGKPEPYVLRRGEGEHAKLFGDLFTVLLSGDETENQFGVIVADSPAGDVIPTHSHDATHETFYVLEGKVRLFFEDTEGAQQTRLLAPGDFGFVPAGYAHAYQVVEASRMMGTLSGGFERFFQHMGTPTDHTGDQPPFIPDFPRMQAAAQQHRMKFLPEHRWDVQE